jgi:flagellum-specific peptidoglycan hydrolase FlgJ
MKTNTVKALLIIGVFTALFVLVSLIVLDNVKRKLYMEPFKYKGGATTKKDYIEWITPMAKSVGKSFGIPWQAMVVQTALETGWGKSSLLSKYNNFGGIKAVPGDNSITMKTKEFINGQWVTIDSKFAAWTTPLEGLEGYARFFHRNKRYAQALKYPNDPYKFIEEIKKAGYATDPNYVAKLHGMLKNDLKA